MAGAQRLATLGMAARRLHAPALPLRPASGHVVALGDLSVDRDEELPVRSHHELSSQAR